MDDHNSFVDRMCLIDPAGSLLLFFRNVDTMIHETGHAVVTLLLSGKVNYIELFQNHGGVTYSVVVGSWKMIPIALAGYVTASLFAVFMFYAQSQGKQRLGLQVITVVALLDLLLFVRNGFGIAWLFGLIALNVAALFLYQNGFKTVILYYWPFCAWRNP
ncbi:M50 family metallopeptidase [Paenibacillus larvae]|uniref:M50 family metallopeptidase n=1 Tax=Paenibacillus larvae TaxID=1464 RepID=UPI00288D1A07|nr:M50 family metallopeptidase [Paenibacillus larvae]MDT2192235.1 M50 family metallopeptidase [Paenibacillus larvae]MDT2259453.1 M50 family metallopeptidase [Paenibacillus larvae]